MQTPPEFGFGARILLKVISKLPSGGSPDSTGSSLLTPQGCTVRPNFSLLWVLIIVAYMVYLLSYGFSWADA